MNPREKLACAMLRVTDAGNGWAPYLSSVLRGLIRRETPEIPTLAVSNDGVLFWSPAFAARESVEVLALGLIHEAMHVLLKHHERAAAVGVVTDADREWANHCQDACINESLDGMEGSSRGGTSIPKAPDWFIRPATLKQPDKLIFEQRYRLPRPSSSSSGSKHGRCGGAAGNPYPFESSKEVQDVRRSDAEMDRYRRETAQAVKDHAQRKGIGSVPGGLAVWANQVLAPPKVDWRTWLASAVRSAVATRPGATDYTFARVSRRQAGLGFGVGHAVVPGFHSPRPRVATLVDTSGSMGHEELQAAVSELDGIFKAVGARVTVCAVDAAVHELREVGSLNEACELLKGGGGTDMAPGIKALGKFVPAPEVVIVLTDGYIPDPGDEPEFRVIWAIIGNKEFTAPWGEVVIVDD